MFVSGSENVNTRKLNPQVHTNLQEQDLRRPPPKSSTGGEARRTLTITWETVTDHSWARLFHLGALNNKNR